MKVNLECYGHLYHQPLSLTGLSPRIGYRPGYVVACILLCKKEKNIRSTSFLWNR